MPDTANVYVCSQLLSRVQLFATPWTCRDAHQASLAMGFFGKNTGVDCHLSASSNLCSNQSDEG